VPLTCMLPAVQLLLSAHMSMPDALRMPDVLCMASAHSLGTTVAWVATHGTRCAMQPQVASQSRAWHAAPNMPLSPVAVNPLIQVAVPRAEQPLHRA
jgi:hypothetical protein